MIISDAYIRAYDNKIAKSFYDSFKKKHGKTRFVRDKKYHSKWNITDTEFSYQISIPQYTVYSNDGRDKGELPNITAIKDWLIFKGKYVKGKEFGVAKKIARDGTEYNHKKKNQKNTLVEPIAFAKAQIKELKSQIGFEMKKRFVQFATKKEINIKF